MSKNDKGWIKVYRQITDSSFWANGKPFDDRSAFIDLILLANHEDAEVQLKDGSFIKIKRGQHLTSVRKLSIRWNRSRTSVSNFLKHFETANMLKIQKLETRRGTLLTIVNYGKFQDRQDTKRDTGMATDIDTGMATTLAQTRIIKNEKEGEEKPALSLQEEYERYVQETGGRV